MSDEQKTMLRCGAKLDQLRADMRDNLELLMDQNKNRVDELIDLLLMKSARDATDALEQMPPEKRDEIMSWVLATARIGLADGISNVLDKGATR